MPKRDVVLLWLQTTGAPISICDPYYGLGETFVSPGGGLLYCGCGGRFSMSVPVSLLMSVTIKYVMCGRLFICAPKMSRGCYVCTSLVPLYDAVLFWHKATCEPIPVCDPYFG